jgi:hypothetical protein
MHAWYKGFYLITNQFLKFVKYGILLGFDFVEMS